MAAWRPRNLKSRGTIAKGKKNLGKYTQLQEAADCEQYNFLTDCIQSRLKPSRIPRLEKDTEDASTRNNLWKISKRFTKLGVQRKTPIIHRTNGLTYTQLEKTKEIAEAYEANFHPILWNKLFYPKIRRKITAYLQLQTTNPTTLNTLNHLRKRQAPGHNNFRNTDLRALPLNNITYLTKIVNVIFLFH
jgi:hypothetical protein